MKTTRNFMVFSTLLLTSIQITPIVFIDSNTEKYSYLGTWSGEKVEKYLDLGIITIPLTETKKDTGLFITTESRRYLTSRFAVPMVAVACVALGYIVGRVTANTSKNITTSSDKEAITPKA